MAYKRRSPILIVEGGTGVQSNTAYAVLCGGTTSTGAIQSIAGVGTSGQVLTSSGAGALPTFQSISSLGVITSITGNTGGAQTGPTITLAGGTTGLSFGGSANTITTTFAGITANGGTVSLATDATTSTVNIGTGAGVKTVTLGSTNTSSSLALRCGTGDFTLASASGTTISALDTGQITMPLQPAFTVRLNSSLSNVTGDGTFYGIVFDTIVYDQNSNINLSGPPTLFTAPVAGIYNFSCCAFFTGLTSSFTDGRINLITSVTGQIVMLRLNPGAIQTSNFLVLNSSVYVKMSAGETAYLQVYVNGSTKTVGLLGDPAFTTYFSGALIA